MKSEDISDLLRGVRHCDQHGMHWIPSQDLPESQASCPWCARDRYKYELEDIQNTFKLAVLAHESRGVTGASHMNYMGDFISVAPSVTAQMKKWIARWDVVLGKLRGT